LGLTSHLLATRLSHAGRHAGIACGCMRAVLRDEHTGARRVPERIQIPLMFPEEHRSLCPLMRLHQCRTCSRWTILPCIPAPSVAHANGSKVSPTINAHPVRIGMARHPRRAWSSRRTQDDQRPTPTSGAAVVAQHRVLLPMPTPLTACTQGPRQRHVPAALGRNMSRGARQQAPGQDCQ